MVRNSKTYAWVTAWSVACLPIILWDASYTFFRPRSMLGGDLHWIWTGYEIYQEVDQIYGVQALQRGDGFPNAQSALNIVELVINVFYLYSTYILDSPVAPLFGFSTNLMTLSKTVLYFAQEYFCGFCNIGHNTAKNLFFFYICTNGLWIIFPTLITIRLGKDLAASLTVSQSIAKKKAQ